jgi:hypothetical protein
VPHDIARLVQLHEGQPVAARVLVPGDVDESRLVEAIDDAALGHLRDAVTGDERDAAAVRSDAQTAMDSSVADLVAAGIQATGALVADPVRDVVSAANELDADEVIVVTEPHLLKETFHRDWASRIRGSLDRPVLHFVAGTDRVVS